MPKLVFKLSDKQSLDFPLAGEHVRLGRNPANDIVIDNSWISSYHAEFRLGADGVIEVRDLNSSNGTTVNGKRIETARLTPGDAVGFGQLEAIFDPPENAGLNGAAARTPVPAPNAVPTASMKKPVSPRVEPVIPISRHEVTEPLPPAGGASRIVVPVPVQPTTLVPAPDGGALLENRRELQQMQAQIAAARSELKVLGESIETLRRDRESEEQNQAQLKLQGEREARELRIRLEKLQEEIEKTESSGAELARTRMGALAQEETELTSRLTGAKSAEAAVAASVVALEEKLAALRNEESGLAAISAQLKTALQEADEAAKRKTAALAGAADAESRATAMRTELETLATRRTALEAEVETAKARLAEIEAGITGAADRALAAKSDAETGENRKAEMLKALSLAEEERKQHEAAAQKFKEELALLQPKHATVTAELEKLAGSIEARAAASTEASVRLEGIEQAIAAAAGRLATIQAESRAVETSLRERESLKATGDAEIAGLTKKLEDLRRTVDSSESAAAELNRQKTSLTDEVQTLRAQVESLSTKSDQLATESEAEKQAAAAEELSAMAEKRASAGRDLERTHAELESLTQQIAAARVEAVQAAGVRGELESLQKRYDEVKADFDQLEERRQTFAEAPDPTWGTVHAMAKGIIKQVDLLDDLLTHLAAHNGSREAIEQMSIFRAGLLDILTEYTVESYRYEAGFTVDVAARKKIQIVESEEDTGEGTRILKTYRPGYVCANGAYGVQTLLRKAEVSILLGR
ncbi:MAG TPA: nucleotide exchange factor GrpE [Verrucomicrobiales bacterium]|nr:nucleotide exchange factor GrpE [Verrucomicrobiales bacterium]